MRYPYWVLRLFFLIAGGLILGIIGFVIWKGNQEITAPQQTRQPLNSTHQKQLESHKAKLKKELTDMSHACIVNMTDRSKNMSKETSPVDLNKWPDMAPSCQPEGIGLKKSTQKGKTTVTKHCTEKLVPLYCQTFGETSDHQHICMVELKHVCTK